MLREQIYKLVKKAEKGETTSRFYNVFIMTVALLSVVPLMFKETNEFLELLDLYTVYILFADYIFNWIAYDNLKKMKAPKAFIVYPFTPLAIIDLISLLPTFGLIAQGWRILRLLRVFKVVHYSKNLSYIVKAFKKESKTLLSVLLIATGYIFISALALFSYEPNTFDNFFGSLYWATTALTTVGYGDVFPLTDVGKFISMMSSLFGIAIIALPAGIITASFIEEINKAKSEGMGKDDETSLAERVADYEDEEEKKHREKQP